MHHDKARRSRQGSGQPGFLLVSMLITTFLIVAVGITAMQLVTVNYRMSSDQLYTVNAQLAVDAGIEKAVEDLNADSTWVGSGGERTLLVGDPELTYESTLAGGADAAHKILTVTGRAYAGGASEPSSERTIEVVLQGSGGSDSIIGDIAVGGGVGGLVLGSSAEIKGAKVFVNGTIGLSSSAKIGTSSDPVEVRSAHQSCPIPPNSSYPAICPSSAGQPITMGSSSEIQGEVKANNQTNGSNMASPGLVPGSVEPLDLPNHDRDSIKNNITTTRTGSDAGCGSSGEEVWADGLRITSSVSVGSSCDVEVEGDVWIDGNVTIDSSATFIVKEGLTSPPVLMIDGSNGLSTSSSVDFESNSDDIGFRVITYWSNSSCSPDCDEVTGIDLYNSKDRLTINIGGSVEAPNTQFYARWSALRLGSSADAGSLIAQKVTINGSANVNFGFQTGGPGEEEGTYSWAVESYKRVFD